jgi:hypothetical protein
LVYDKIDFFIFAEFIVFEDAGERGEDYIV